MASKRHIRRKSCQRKVRHLTRAEAEAAMYKIIRQGKKGGGHLNVYHCRFCGGYHFGHWSGNRGIA